ncbi:MAG: hypothetical protein ACRDRH_09650 [Pseudonocardia sp.]
MAKKLREYIKKPDPATFRGWLFVIVAGAILALLALVHRGGVDELQAYPADGSTGCQLEVAVDELNVQDEPIAGAQPIEVLRRGALVDGTRTITDGFRELEGGRWALNGSLNPLLGSNCA